MLNDLLLKETREHVDAYLGELFTERITQAREIGGSYERLWSTLESVVFAGGKRIRPYLTVVGYGSLDTKIEPVAAAQELIHCAMLVHDDVIDRDFSRHGQKNVNGMYRDTYMRLIDSTIVDHYANSAAILAGDALLSEAYCLIASCGYTGEVKDLVSRQLHRSIYEVIGGELMDVEAGIVVGTEIDPLQVYRYKTAGYSFIGPLVSGALCAGADAATIQKLHDFGAAAGIAFQIQDDLLGVFGDEVKTGKSTTSDLREGKLTTLVQAHQRLMNDEQSEHFAQWFGVASATDQELGALRQDMRDSGAYIVSIQVVDSYFDRAEAIATECDSAWYREKLGGLINGLRERGE